MLIKSGTRTLYQRMGGEDNIRSLVHSFYQFMGTLNQTQEVRNMHAKNLKVSEDKLFMFLSGWMGGPSLYIEKYGHPRLRQRHMPFKIDTSARDQWMLCMKHALDATVEDQSLRDELMQAFYDIADFMRNQPE